MHPILTIEIELLAALGLLASTAASFHSVLSRAIDELNEGVGTIILLGIIVGAFSIVVLKQSAPKTFVHLMRGGSRDNQAQQSHAIHVRGFHNVKVG